MRYFDSSNYYMYYKAAFTTVSRFSFHCVVCTVVHNLLDA